MSRRFYNNLLMWNGILFLTGPGRSLVVIEPHTLEFDSEDDSK